MSENVKVFSGICSWRIRFCQAGKQPDTWGSCSRSQAVDCGRQRPAPARGSGYSGPSWGAGPPCPSALRPCALKDLTLTSPTTPRHRTECPGRPQGLRGGGHGVARSGPRGPPSRAGRCAVFVVGRCHGMLRRLSAEAQRQVWLSPAIPGPGRWVAPSPVTLRGQILEAGRDVVSSPHARRPPSARGSIYTTVVAKHCKLPATVDPPPCPRGS